MKRFFEPSPPLVTPGELVRGFTKKSPAALALPPRAILAFDGGDNRRLMERHPAALVDAWVPFRWVHTFEHSRTALTRSGFGGPNIASCLEELAAFGVSEFILWGYCGALAGDLAVGDILAAESALREEGISYHYLDHKGDTVGTDWFGEWGSVLAEEGVRPCRVWSTDAIYRETAAKVDAYRKKGFAAVEMEVASFYAVARFLKVRAMAFLVVSDLLRGGAWKSGFHTKALKAAGDRMADFIVNRCILP